MLTPTAEAEIGPNAQTAARNKEKYFFAINPPIIYNITHYMIFLY
jgi:hypothetical protein